MKDFQPQNGDRTSLNIDQLQLLEDKVLPTARKWVRGGGALADHGRRTLEYWGEGPANPTGETA